MSMDPDCIMYLSSCKLLAWILTGSCIWTVAWNEQGFRLDHVSDQLQAMSMDSDWIMYLISCKLSAWILTVSWIWSVASYEHGFWLYHESDQLQAMSMDPDYIMYWSRTSYEHESWLYHVSDQLQAMRMDPDCIIWNAFQANNYLCYPSLNLFYTLDIPHHAHRMRWRRLYAKFKICIHKSCKATWNLLS